MLDYAWIIPLLPAASFVLILFFGKRMPWKGAELGIAAVGIALLLALVVNVQWFSYRDSDEASGGHGAETSEEHSGDETSDEHAGGLGTGETAAANVGSQDDTHTEEDTGHTGEDAGHAEEGDHADEGGHGEAAEGEGHGDVHPVEPKTAEITWFETSDPDKPVEVGMLLDGPAVMMLFVVTLVSLLVHVYSTDYVGGDRRYTHFFAFLSLFTASMLGLVMAKTTLQLIVMWELVGVCSFALIGHWWEEKPNSDAALKAFITNRVGDVGLLCGMIILFFAAGGTFDIMAINEWALSDAGAGSTALTIAALCLIAAVMSKSGQFILHTWLPDAMAGPTPVSALIHAATMVVAGIFMVGRLYGVFFQGLEIGTSTINALAVVGGITVIGGAALAFVQDDIKKVLAYSTVSQLGYMVMALGVGAWTAAFFHLFTHAFFKACLFLGSGSVSHAVHSFDMRKDMGGLRKWMPHTYRTFIIATLALIGIFPLAGFWSKDEILAGSSQLGGGYTTFLVVGTIGAFMTAAYMTRCVYLTFFGEFRGHGHPHESGPRITVPLWILAGLAVVAGFANFPEASWLSEDLTLRFEHFYEPVASYFPSGAHNFDHPVFSLPVALVSSLIGLSGVALGYLWYWRKMGPHGITERVAPARWGYTALKNKYYFDWLYSGVIAGAFKGPIARAANWVNQNVIDGVVNAAGRSATVVGRFVYKRIDQGVVDNVVDGSGMAAEGGGQVFRKLTTGKVQQYGALLFGATAVFAAVLVAVV